MYTILEVKEVLAYNTYEFKDDKGNNHKLTIELINVPKLNLGDKIKISSELLNENLPNFVQPYAFIKVDDVDEKNVMGNGKDFLAVHIGENNYILKRVYG